MLLHKLVSRFALCGKESCCQVVKVADFKNGEHCSHFLSIFLLAYLKKRKGNKNAQWSPREIDSIFSDDSPKL